MRYAAARLRQEPHAAQEDCRMITRPSRVHSSLDGVEPLNTLSDARWPAFHTEMEFQ